MKTLPRADAFRTLGATGLRHVTAASTALRRTLARFLTSGGPAGDAERHAR